MFNPDTYFSEAITISKILHPILSRQQVEIDLLRLDLIHSTVSGNKWFKLKYNIEYALSTNKQQLLSFGGAFSNHLHALAYAGQLYGIPTIGIIRGEPVDNATLADCKRWGMKCIFWTREAYRNKNEIATIRDIQDNFPEAHIIPEGGNNDLGIKGCEEILKGVDLSKHGFLACSVGTGATLSGILNVVGPNIQVMGFAAIKNGGYLRSEIEKNTGNKNWQLHTDYHFGGFARKNEELHRFIKDFSLEQKIELDFVYNAKMMYGLFDLIAQKRIPEGSKIMAIHTGGIQGNRSFD